MRYLPSATGTRSNPGGTGAPLASFRTLPATMEAGGGLSPLSHGGGAGGGCDGPRQPSGWGQSRSAIAISAFSSVSVSSGRPTVMRMQSASAPPP